MRGLGNDCLWRTGRGRHAHDGRPLRGSSNLRPKWLERIFACSDHRHDAPGLFDRGYSRCAQVRRSGVPVGNIFAFILAAPLLNPISFLYGLTLAEPYVIVCFFVAKLFLAIIAGEVWEYWLPSKSIDTAAIDAEPMPAPGLRRIIAVFVHSCREATGPMLLFGSIALLSSGLLSASSPTAPCKIRCRIITSPGHPPG